MLQINNAELTSSFAINDFPKAIDEEYLVDDFEEINVIQHLYRTYYACLSEQYGLTSHPPRIANIYLEEAPIKNTITQVDNCVIDNYSATNLPNKKYDLFIIYDVIDHLSSVEGVVKFVQNIQFKAQLYLIRCHPYQSRCGTHLMHLNKAYAHLFAEIKGRHTLLFPSLDTYREIFVNYNILLETRNKENVEQFFVGNTEYAKRLLEFDSPNVQTIDFILKNGDFKRL